MIRRILLAGAAVPALLAASPARAQQVVLCVNCSQAQKQLLEYALQLRQAANGLAQLQQQIMQVQYTIQFYMTLVQNTISLPANIYREIIGTIQQLQGLVQTASLISGPSGNMMTSLSAASYLAGSIGNLANRLSSDDAALAMSINAAGNTIDQSHRVILQQTTQLDAFQRQAAEADGIKQVLQANAGIAATVGNQLAVQHAALVTPMQALVTAEARRADREAAIEAQSRGTENAGRQAACSAAASIGVGTTVAGCTNLAAPAATGVSPGSPVPPAPAASYVSAPTTFGPRSSATPAAPAAATGCGAGTTPGLVGGAAGCVPNTSAQDLASEDSLLGAASAQQSQALADAQAAAIAASPPP
jgi:P-type conjugative transfer protein TrbJ